MLDFLVLPFLNTTKSFNTRTILLSFGGYMGMFDFIKKKKEEAVPSAPSMQMDAPPTPAEGLPKMPEATKMPDMPTMPESPSMPESPAFEHAGMPDMPDAPQDGPELPKEPEQQPVSDVEMPKLPERQEIPTSPDIPSLAPNSFPYPEKDTPTQPPDIKPEETEGLFGQDKPEVNAIEPLKPTDIQTDDVPAHLPADDLEEEVDSPAEPLPVETHTEEVSEPPAEITEPVAPLPTETPEAHDIVDEEIMTSKIIDETLFVNVGVFRHIAEVVNSMSNESKVAEDALFRIKDLTLNKEKVFDKWQNDLEQMERELIHLDKLLFNI